MRETVTLKRTQKGYWMQKFDDYEFSYKRISKKEALETIKRTRENKKMYSDYDEKRTDGILIFGYFN